MEDSSSSASRASQLAQRFVLMNQRFFSLLLFAVKPQNAFARFATRRGAALPCALRIPRFARRVYSARAASSSTRPLRLTGLCARARPRLVAARIARFPLRRLRGDGLAFRGKLFVAPGQVPRCACWLKVMRFSHAVHFQRGLVQHVLVLADFGVQRIDALVQAVLIAFLFVNGLRVLRFRGG